MAYGDDIFQRQMEARRLYGTGMGDLAPYINKSADIMAQGFQEAQKQPLATAQLEAELYGKQYAMNAEKQKALVDQARYENEMKLKQDQLGLEKQRLAQQKELELLRMNMEREKAGAKGERLDPVTVRSMQEIGSRSKDLKQNLAGLEKIIDKYGTEEMFGPQSEQMDALIYKIAIDYAKIVDPASVAREGEVAAAQKYMLPVKGWLRTERSAKTMIKDMSKDVDQRVQSKVASTGIDVTGKPLGQSQQMADQSAPTTKTVGSNVYVKVKGGWQLQGQTPQTAGQ